MVRYYIEWWLCYLMAIIVFPFSGSTEIFKYNGSTVVLTCPFGRTYGYSLQWSFRKMNTNQVTFYSNDSNVNIYLDTAVQRRLAIVGNHTIGGYMYDLQISNISESDEGNYTCFSYDNYYHQQLYLIVPPSEVIFNNVTQKNRSVGTEERNLTILCSAVGGKPPPVVTMSIGGKIVARDNQFVQYTIKSISRAYDLKTVHCTAENDGNKIYPVKNSSIIYLNLKPLNLTIYPDVLSTEETTLLRVTCLSYGSRPVAFINWTIGHMDVTAYSSSNVTHYYADDTYNVASTLAYSVNRTFHNQNITCRATNLVLPEGRQKSRQLYIKIKPSKPTMAPDDASTEENKTLRVTCVSNESRPAAVIHWTIGQMDVTYNSTSKFTHYSADDIYYVTSTLTYMVNRSFHNQNITCRATNEVLPEGRQTSRTLNISFPPNVTVSTEMFDLTVANRTIICFPNGNPPYYTYRKWKHLSKYGQLIRELDGDSNGVLTLPDVPKLDRYQDTGQYTCTVSNGIIDKDGNMRQSGTGFMTISGPPVITNNNTDIMYGTLGQHISIHAYLYSTPKYTTYKWYKRNADIIANTYTMDIAPVLVNCTFHGQVVQLDGYKATLTINNLKEEDFYSNYTVYMSNVFGQIEHSVLLLSASPPLTPLNCSVIGLTTSSIVVDWVPGYNGGSAQTFIVEYRVLKRSSVWSHVRVPSNHEWSGSMSYTIQNLQSATIYEIRISAVNIFGRSGSANVITVPTASLDDRDEDQFVSRKLFGGVVGSLVILIVIGIIIGIFKSKVMTVLSRFGLAADSASTKLAKSKKSSPSESSKVSYQNIGETATYEDVSGEGHDPRFKTGGNSKVLSNETTSNMYEMLGKESNVNTYDDFQRPKGPSEKIYMNVN